MIRDRLVAFLAAASERPDLLIDLCAEPDLMSRAHILALLERHGVASDAKDGVIAKLVAVDILEEKPHDSFSVNPMVAQLVNFYERRGELISATFLRDQMTAIVETSMRLRRALAAPVADGAAVGDAIDDLCRLVRYVATIGNQHYVACMRLLGDIKRTVGEQALDQRIDRLEVAQRRYIEPLRDLTDPNGAYRPRLAEVRALAETLERRPDLLTDSYELERMVRRLRLDVISIDHHMLRRFVEMSDAARNLLESLFAEQSLKEALAFCLARLDQAWLVLSGRTVIAPMRRIAAAPPMDAIDAFFADVVRGALLPRPRPLAIHAPQRDAIETRVVTERRMWRMIAAARVIESWPAFVLQHVAAYDLDHLLAAMALPLVRPHPQVRLMVRKTQFRCVVHGYALRLHDYSVFWEEANDNAAAAKRGDHPTADARVSV